MVTAADGFTVGFCDIRLVEQNVQRGGKLGDYGGDAEESSEKSYIGGS